jgi:predicted permease
LSGGGGGSGALAEGAAIEPGREPYVTYFAVTPDALRTLGVPLLGGRDLTAAEASTRSAVAIVNRDLARQLWPSELDVIGRRFRLTAPDVSEWFTVVGIVADFRPYDVREEGPHPFAFVGYPYMPASNTGLTIRVAGMAPAAVTAAVREAVRRSDPDLALFNVRTGEENRRLTFWTERIFGWMFSIFGAVALFLASIGIYGVLSYSVAQRTQEIGVRVALGASRRDVAALVLGHGARLAAAGIGLGVIGAFAVTRIVQSFLYNVSASDPLSFLATAGFLGMIALLAGYVPARRATSVDPIVALRAE